MLIVLLFVCFVIVPISRGNPADKLEIKTNLTAIHGKELSNELNDKKITVESEGGAILSNTPIQSLPKENQEFLMTSDAENTSNKVKPRKGAFLEESRNISTEENVLPPSNSSLSSPQSTVAKGKPPIVSAEAIAKTDLLNKDPAVDEVEERMIKKHKMVSTGHPDMVMPIIITVLVVPMFAVIGYMALKRGQEAWKNRHYKRMDFLLDGMYND